MSDAILIRGEIDDGVDPTLYALVVGPDGIMLTQSDVEASGITLNVYDLNSETPDVSLVTQTLNPGTTYNGFPALSNTLQTTGWQKSSDGYNFRYLLASADLPSPGFVGGHTYRIEVVFQLTNATTQSLGGGIGRVNFELVVRPSYS